MHWIQVKVKHMTKMLGDESQKVCAFYWMELVHNTTILADVWMLYIVMVTPQFCFVPSSSACDIKTIYEYQIAHSVHTCSKYLFYRHKKKKRKGTSKVDLSSLHWLESHWCIKSTS